MAKWKLLAFTAVLGFGLVGAGCTEDQTPATTHYAARRSVTGSNVPQAPAYGDGVQGDTSRTEALNEMNQAAGHNTSIGGGLAGAAGGGR